MVDMPPDATNLKALVRTPRVVLKAGILYSKSTWACFNLKRYHGTIMTRLQVYDWRVLFCHLDFTNVATAANKQQNDLEREPNSGNGHQVG